VSFGDAVVPPPALVTFPVLLPLDPPSVRAYPREAVIAEKLEAMVTLDIRNSRMKDFYDIWFISQTWPFDRSTLRGQFQRHLNAATLHCLWVCRLRSPMNS
jgi:hypothetical protein